MKLTHGSLYSGIGGWLLSAQWAGIDNVFTCEIDKFCNKVIDKNFPEIPKENRHHDIKETDFTKYAGRIDILSTSDPCQPFSFAGKRGGTTDDRFLWPFTIEAIRTIKPPFVVFENVFGFISMAFETVASDLEAEEYTVESFIIPACGVGTWHRRDRLWIIAYNSSFGCVDGEPKEKSMDRRKQAFNEITPGSKSIKDVSNPNPQRLQGESCGQIGSLRETQGTPQGSKPGGTITEGWRYWETESGLGGMADRLPSWMDYFGTEPDIPRVAKGVKNRVDRLKALGNSIYPPIAYIIFEAIKEVNST